MTNFRRLTRPAIGLLAIASLALLGCGGDDEPADDTTTTAEQTTTTAPGTTTTEQTNTSAATETTIAPTAGVLVYPSDHTARITVDTTEVTAGEVVTATVTGFAPNTSLSTALLGNWPPTEMPDPAHMITLRPDVATTDSSGGAEIEVTIDPVCGQGACYLVVADGIGANGIYAGMKMDYQG